MNVSYITRINDGNLVGTELETVMGMLAVKYPHRKTKNLYVPPMKTEEKEIKTWHCCQENCKQPDFEDGIDALLAHLELHAGRLFKRLKPVTKPNPPMVVVNLPPNPFDNIKKYPGQGANLDRRVTVNLYIDSVKLVLRRQGIGVLENT